MGIEIEQILRIDKTELEPLLLASLGEGLLFVERLARDWETGTNRFDAAGEALWGAFAGEGLIGVCGLNRDPYTAVAECVGRVCYLYVLPVRRREGAGRALVHMVIDQARAHFQRLHTCTDSPIAAAFYERLGFASVRSREHVTHALSFPLAPPTSAAAY